MINSSLLPEEAGIGHLLINVHVLPFDALPCALDFLGWKCLSRTGGGDTSRFGEHRPSECLYISM